MIVHIPFLAAGIYFEEGEDEEKIKCQTAHRELVASAKRVEIGQEIDGYNLIGCLFAAESNKMCSTLLTFYADQWNQDDGSPVRQR